MFISLDHVFLASIHLSIEQSKNKLEVKVLRFSCLAHGAKNEDLLSLGVISTLKRFDIIQISSRLNSKYNAGKC